MQESAENAKKKNDLLLIILSVLCEILCALCVKKNKVHTETPAFAKLRLGRQRAQRKNEEYSVENYQ